MNEQEILAKQIYDVRYVKLDNRVDSLEDKMTTVRQELSDKTKADSEEFKNLHKLTMTHGTRLDKVEDRTDKHSTDLKEVAEAIKSLSNTITKAVWITGGIVSTIMFLTSGYIREILKIGGVM